MDVRHPVGAGQHLRGVARRRHAVGADIGAEIGRARAAQAADGAVALAGDLQLAFGVAGVVRRDQVLAAVFDPFHRAVELSRRERDQEILGIELAAHAEAAADVGLDHGDGVLGQPHLLRQDAAVVEHHLGHAGDGEMALGRVPFGEQTARLHRHRAETLHREALAAGVRRVAERGVGVALFRRQRDDVVAAGRLEQQAFVLARRWRDRPPAAAPRCRARWRRAHPRPAPRCRPPRRRSARRRSAPCPCAMTGCWYGLNSGSSSCRMVMTGISPIFAAISAAVMTACTPGRFSAADASIERMRPCATELRRNTACSASALGTSSTILAAAAQEAQVLQALDRAADRPV